MTSYTVPTPASSPVGVYVVPSGDVWICEFLGQKIAKFNVQTKTFTEYPVPPTLLGPAVVRAFTSTRYLWFTAIGANAIGRVDITTGAMKAYPNTANLGVPIEDTNDGKGNVCKIGMIEEGTCDFMLISCRVFYRAFQHVELSHPEHWQDHYDPSVRRWHYHDAGLAPTCC